MNNSDKRGHTPLSTIKQWLFGQTRSTGERFWMASLLAILFYLSQCMLVLWWNTDDYRFSLVLDGVYSQYNYCMFFSPVIAWLVRGIGFVLPYADGRILLGGGLILLGLWCVFYLLFTCTNRFTALLVFALLVLANYDVNILHSSFTMAACLLAGMGMLLISSYVKGIARLPLALVGGVLVLFGYLWRAEACLIAIPFFGLIVLADALKHAGDKKWLIRYFKRLLLCLIPILLLCAGADRAAKAVQSKEEYAAGVTFNYYRSSVRDFAGKDYSIIAEPMTEAGISENDYQMARELILMDTDVTDTEYLKTIDRISTLTGSEKIDVLLKDGLLMIARKIRYEPFICISVAAFAYFLLLLLFSRGNLWSKLELLCDYLGAGVVILFLLYQGHILLYLIEGIIFYALFVMFDVFLLNDLRLTGPRCGVRFLLLAVSLAIALGGIRFGSFSADVKDNLFDTALNAKKYDNYEQPFIDALDPSEETVMIWGVFDRNEVLEDAILPRSKLVSREFLMHNILDGEWAYHQPYYDDLMRDAGIENPMKALLQREHTYYAAHYERSRMVLTYLREHYDPGADMTPIGMLEGVPVWRFKASEPQTEY